MGKRIAEILSRVFILGLLCLPIGQLYTAAFDGRQSISINITGDVLLDRGVKTLIDKVGVEGVLRGLVDPEFSSADYTLINLECPATEIIAPANKRHVFRAKPSLLTGLRSVGVTHAGLANNHSFDQGEAGFIDTMENLAKAGIASVGIAKGKSEGVLPELIVKNGIKIAVFAVNMIEVTLPDRELKGTGPCDVSSEMMHVSIRSFRQGHPEFYNIVFLHWGEEYSLFPTEDQNVFAHALIDVGADAVIVCHAHVIQFVEVYHGRPIAYSLGNLLFDQTLPETQRGLVITLEFGKDSITGVSLHRIRQINGAPHLAGEMKVDLDIDKTILPSEIFSMR